MADSVNLKKSFASLNEKLAHQFDQSGVPRSFTVPYIDGEQMADHINAIGQAATQSGGLTNNLVTSAHHAKGKGWGSGDGHTVGHPADKLRSTIIPKDNEQAKASIAAAQTHLNNIKHLLGDSDPALKTAQSQLDLVKRADGAGMNLLDFGVMLIQIMDAPNAAVAKAHSGTKAGGHSVKLRAPEEEAAQAPQESTQGDQGAPQGDGQAPEAQAPPAAAPAAPAAQAAPSGSAPQPA